MGSRRWRLANSTKQRGSPGLVGRFLPAPGRLAACPVAVPESMDKKVGAAGGLAGAGVRSFEVWWDVDEKSLQLVLAGEERDIPRYRRAFANMYPNAAFEDLGRTVPRWFDPAGRGTACSTWGRTTATTRPSSTWPRRARSRPR